MIQGENKYKEILRSTKIPEQRSCFVKLYFDLRSVDFTEATQEHWKNHVIDTVQKH